MPRGDRTGPMGMGPMTGRGAGYCNGFAAPGYAKPAPFAGGLGSGCGRGFRRMFYATGIPGWARDGHSAQSETKAAAPDEKAVLSGQAAFLENQLQQIKRRLSSLETE